MSTTRTGAARGAHRAAIVVALAALLATACSSPPVEVTATPLTSTSTPTPSPTPSATAQTATSTPSTTPTPQARHPLTGVATDDARLDEPVLAAKIDNHPSAFPHTGTERADVVYEEVVEGGFTRLVPLFHSEIPDVVGPIRSGRFLDLELLSPYRAVMAFAGARPEVMSALVASDHVGVVSDSGSAPFFRGDDRPAPHNLYFDAASVLDIGRTRDEVAAVTSPFTFGRQPEGGTQQDQVDIAMTYWQTTSWSWDADAEVYRRSTRGQPYVVAGSGQVGAANVVVVLTGVSQLRSGEPYVHTDLEGEGDAVLLRGGRRYDIQWRKQDTTSHLEFVFADGTPVPFARGKTWIHLAPVGAIS